MRKYFGRLIEAIVRGISQHLLDFGRIIGLNDDELAQMSQQKDDDLREQLFLKFIEGRHGGPVDWKGSASDIYDVLMPCLSEEERDILPEVADLPIAQPARIVEALALRLGDAGRLPRAVESFGDFVIVLMIPRAHLEEFDRRAKNWLA